MTQVARRAKQEAPSEAPVGKPGRDYIDGGYFTSRHDVAVVGVDSSATAPAIVVLDPTTLAYYGWVFRPKSKGARRLLDIKNWADLCFTKIILSADERPGIAMEGYGFASQKAHTIGEAGGQLKVSMLGAYGFSNIAAYPHFVAPNALKKYATGSGSSSVGKNEVLLAVYKKWGVECKDDNLADAYVLARIARHLHGRGEIAALAYEAEVLDKVQRHAEYEAPK